MTSPGMTSETIFLPVAALAIWTFCVLLLVPLRRFRASFAGKVGPGDFRYGESARVPGEVSLPNRNYMNLLELPVLFYVLALTLFVTGRVDGTYVAMAWAFVALRVVHTLVHIAYNNVFHRLTIFALANVVLLVMWLRFAWSLLAH